MELALQLTPNLFPTNLQAATKVSGLPEVQAPPERLEGGPFREAALPLSTQPCPSSSHRLQTARVQASWSRVSCVSRDTGMVTYKVPPVASSIRHPIPTTSGPRDGEPHSPWTLRTAG